MVGIYLLEFPLESFFSNTIVFIIAEADPVETLNLKKKQHYPFITIIILSLFISSLLFCSTLFFFETIIK